VTIAVGFRFHGGLALCADTQETIENTKTWTPKLKFEPSTEAGKDSADDLMLAIAGSGEGPWVDKLTEQIWESISVAETFGGACHSAQQAIKQTYREYGRIFQPGFLPGADLIYGIKMQRRSGLFKANGPIVNEVPHYGIIGSGYYMAEFLIKRLHHNLLSGTQAVLLAAYVLFECKEHVEGCGGDSHIALLSERGRSNVIDTWRVQALTEMLAAQDTALASFLLPGLDWGKSREQHQKSLELLIARLGELRKRAEEHHKEWNELMGKWKELLDPSVSD
jgi:ABC-type cobalt transport system substrate-binding protein